MASINHSFTSSVSQHVPDPRMIRPVAEHRSGRPAAFNPLGFIVGRVKNGSGLKLEGAPIRLKKASEKTATNQHAAAVTVRTFREAVARALNGQSSSGRAAPDLFGWSPLREAVNYGTFTRFTLANPASPAIVVIDLPDTRHAVPEERGYNFVARAHIDFPEEYARGGMFPADTLDKLVAMGFLPDDGQGGRDLRPHDGFRRFTASWTAYHPRNARGLVGKTLVDLDTLFPGGSRPGVAKAA